MIKFTNYADLNNYKQMDKDYDELDMLDKISMSRKFETRRDFEFNKSFKKVKGKIFGDCQQTRHKLKLEKGKFNKFYNSAPPVFKDPEFPAREVSIFGHGLDKYGRPRDEDA